MENDYIKWVYASIVITGLIEDVREQYHHPREEHRKSNPSEENFKSDENDKRICQFYMRGECKLGNFCLFKHAKENKQKNENEVNTKNEICKNHQRGFCRFRERCKYKHSIDAPPKMQEICRDDERGRCRFGDNCRYQHKNHPQNQPNNKQEWWNNQDRKFDQHKKRNPMNKYRNENRTYYNQMYRQNEINSLSWNNTYGPKITRNGTRDREVQEGQYTYKQNDTTQRAYCRYNEKGYCKYGKECRFEHRKVCYYYRNGKICRNEDNCRFLHIEKTPNHYNQVNQIPKNTERTSRY